MFYTSAPPLPPPVGPPPGLPPALRKAPDQPETFSFKDPRQWHLQARVSSRPWVIINIRTLSFKDHRLSSRNPSTKGEDSGSGRVFHVSSLFPTAEPRTGNMAQHYRKTGASFSEVLGASPGGAVTADRLIHAIDGLRKAQHEDKTGSKGVVSALKEPEKLDVFLARGCSETKVAGVYGKELFHGIKRAGHHAKHMLQLIRWPVLINNRLALAIAGFWWGGEESYTLLASDCATAKAEQVEAWTPPTEHKLEPPPPFLTWLRYAENAVKVFGSAYGLEHVPERMAFLSALCEANEEDENAFPVGIA